METIEVHIHQLGAIRNSHIRITPVMFFSGESGLGKSYLAILCHYFFDLLLDKGRLARFFDSNVRYDYNQQRKEWKDSGFIGEISTQDLEKWMAVDVTEYMRYMLQNEQLLCDIEIHLPTSVNLRYSYQFDVLGLDNQEENYYKIELPDLSYRVKDDDLMGLESPFSVLARHHLMDVLLGDLRALKDCVILPPSRGICFTEDVTPKTGIFQKFMDKISELQRIPEIATGYSQQLIELYEQIIDGKIERKDNKYIYKTSNVEMPISATASSIKEIAPLSLILHRLLPKHTSLLFEEPEAHLHPAMQRKMADLLALFINAGASFQITTHSDYLLRRINELIILHQIKERTSDSDFEKFCEEQDLNPILALSTDRISAYLLRREPDGTSTIEHQDINEGIPYTTFYETAVNGLEKTEILKEKYYELSHSL